MANSDNVPVDVEYSTSRRYEYDLKLGRLKLIGQTVKYLLPRGLESSVRMVHEEAIHRYIQHLQEVAVSCRRELTQRRRARVVLQLLQRTVTFVYPSLNVPGTNAYCTPQLTSCTSRKLV